MERLLDRIITRPSAGSVGASVSANAFATRKQRPDGRVQWQLKRPFRDGTTHFVFTPEDFIARLAALVPRPWQTRQIKPHLNNLRVIAEIRQPDLIHAILKHRAQRHPDSLTA